LITATLSTLHAHYMRVGVQIYQLSAFFFKVSISSSFHAPDCAPFSFLLHTPLLQPSLARLCLSQSGGCVDGYNIKPSAVTDDGTLTEDVVIVSLGARYKHYCANVARTYVIDSVPTVR